MVDNRNFDMLMMGRALELARLGMGFASPNPMVGAVITDEAGLIVGEGWHRQWGGPHAEVNAVDSARRRGADLTRCTIYVTLEPCAHYGKTPPCALLLRDSGFRRVVIGCLDPFPKVNGRGIEILREAGIEVTCGVMDKECRELNRRFFFAHTHKRPWVMLKWAQSLDGFMAAADGSPVKFSTPVSSVLMHRERAGTDAILVGTGTLKSDNPSLTLRLWPGRRLRPVVLKSGRTPADAKVLANPDAIILSNEGGLRATLETLYSDFGIISLMVEGGPALLRSFLTDRELWQEMRIEVSDCRLAEGIPAPEVALSGMKARRLGNNMIYTRMSLSLGT